MTGSEIVFIGFVVGAFALLATTLGFVSWDENRRQKRLGINWYRQP